MVSQTTFKPCILFILLASLALSKENKHYDACTKEDLQKTAGFNDGKVNFTDKPSFNKYRKALGSAFAPCSQVGMRLPQLGECGNAGDKLHDLLSLGKSGSVTDFKDLARKVASALKELGPKCGGAKKSGKGKGGHTNTKDGDKKKKGSDKNGKDGGNKRKGGHKGHKQNSIIYFG